MGVTYGGDGRAGGRKEIRSINRSGKNDHLADHSV